MKLEEKKLPNGWEMKKFEDLLDYIQPTKYIVDSTEYSDEYKTPVLTAGKSFVIGYTNEKQGIFNQLPVIIFDDFTTANKFVKFPFKVKSSAMKILKPKDSSVNIEFVFYYMQTVRITFDTHKRYWISTYSKLPVPIPPKDEQQAIVAKIEELFSELENGKKELLTAQDKLKTYRQSLLKWAFEGRLTNENLKYGELPKGWEVIKVFELGEISTGSTPSKSNPAFYSNKFPFYKPTDLEAGYNVRESSDNLSELGIKEARFLPSNSILVTCIGATIGKIGIIRREGASNQQINAIIPSKNFDPNFIYYQAIAPKFQNAIIENYSQTTLPILNKSKFQNLEMYTCSLLEQQKIVAILESKLTICDAIEETIKTSINKCETLRQSILQKAFLGELINKKNVT